jgi:NAD(P)-dependent dehydrogenase (short-subunit alcohol dehydrogenase family)
MRKVCVITGGGSGIGFETARIMGRDYYLVLGGRTKAKLEKAAAALKAEGTQAEIIVCDVSDRAAVDQMALQARQLGPVTAVINAAGLSPSMGDARTVMEVNAMGTINMNEAFFEVMEAPGCVLDISSIAAYTLPKPVLPTGCYRHSRTDKGLFMRKMMGRVGLFPRKMRSDLSYCISKHFVIWYARTDAAKFGTKGLRVLSISPGLVETPMAEAEKGSASYYIKHCAIKRYGRAEELASLIAFCAGEAPGYLTGADILCDGGCIASGFDPLLDWISRKEV